MTGLTNCSEIWLETHLLATILLRNNNQRNLRQEYDSGENIAFNF